MVYKMSELDIHNLPLTKYIFFTGKGGVGKTSTACAVSVALADQGKKVILVSTDPASNLQDVFKTNLDNKGIEIKEVANLTVANFEPESAAAEYRESVVGPFRGKLPEVVIQNMEEQLSGSCTVEIAAFNEFTHFLTDEKVTETFDHIVFDTAPTGHTLRMLQLPSAWTDFISENTTGASCLGQLSGLEDKKEVYRNAVDTLADGQKTTLMLVTRPDYSPMKEAERASKELSDIGVNNQLLIVNGLATEGDDPLSNAIYDKQQKALKEMPEMLKSLDTKSIALKPFNIVGINHLRNFFQSDYDMPLASKEDIADCFNLSHVIEDLHVKDKKVIFTMGKGGVGKTTMAAAIARGLAQKGKKVHLTTTDPAAHLNMVTDEVENISISFIDENEELSKYKKEVLSALPLDTSKEDRDYIEEDLKSPCTQEIAVFRAFAELVERSNDEVVVIDTAPTGHTLLLLDSTQSYHKEIERSNGQVPESVMNLLPRLRDDSHTEVLILTLAETTPVYEAKRLLEDLKRAGLYSKWWLINSSLYATETTNKLMLSKANQEAKWINHVHDISNGQTALIKWIPEDVTNNVLENL
ncbi:arsenical pump-driving ATPase [Acidaminobacter sp. JC074]|uniref:arsenical pump-driving ATPase n=1 Tax=Acidaminobacter sp. JC074 TaxID=2530199 RepID=UPI00272C61A3|nr:arsenical pump-driving ATPase [Acidaminobacter sp. JC074]